MNSSNSSSFDSAAAAYDADFTFSEIGKFQRARVYHWLNQVNFFEKKKKVFEVNCGTAYDAEEFSKKGHTVIATDGSAEMIAYAKANRIQTIQFYTLSFEDIKSDPNFKDSEVLFSNFGGLNCLNQKGLSQFFEDINEMQQKGDLFVGVFMAKGCFMEDVYHFFKLQWQKIGRRNTKEGLLVNVEGVAVHTYYYSPAEVTDLMKEDYKVILRKPIAFFLPPSYLEPLFKKLPFVLKILNNFEQFFGQWGRLSSNSDHYIIIAEKK